MSKQSGYLCECTTRALDPQHVADRFLNRIFFDSSFVLPREYFVGRCIVIIADAMRVHARVFEDEAQTLAYGESLVDFIDAHARKICTTKREKELLTYIHRGTHEAREFLFEKKHLTSR